MVYYGLISKGCQRCRQRKIKCDQRKPGCSKCEKSRKPCPGYRDLGEVIFRDESKRIATRARQAEAADSISVQDIFNSSIATCKAYAADDVGTVRPWRNTVDISRPFSAAIHDLGACFFFNEYVSQEPPFYYTHHSWLAKSYVEQEPNGALRAVIEAIGMAGLANIFGDSHLEALSRRQNYAATAALRQILNDHADAASDITLMVVILLGFYQEVHSGDWKHYTDWICHVRGATALLEHRSCEQSFTERAAELYLQIRTQIDIQDAAFDIEMDLRAWFQGLTSSWRYTVCEVLPSAAPKTFGNKMHAYPSLWIAEAWNSWRVLRLLINQIIVRHYSQRDFSNNERISISRSVVRQMSADICVSTASFALSPRLMSLIKPLYLVAIEKLNGLDVRLFAVEQLRHINAKMGIRQAGLFAETASKYLDTGSCTGPPIQSDWRLIAAP